MKKFLNNKILIILWFISLIVIIYNCTIKSDRNSIENIKRGMYVDIKNTEQIIIIDSINYIHRYKINNAWISDTSHYFYLSPTEKKSTSKYHHSYTVGNEYFTTVIFENFFISDSSLYLMSATIRRNNEAVMFYYPNYNSTMFESSPKPVIAPEIDACCGDLLYYTKNE